MLVQYLYREEKEEKNNQLTTRDQVISDFSIFKYSFKCTLRF